MKSIDIKNVGGIASLHLELGEPGVYELRGPNGSGKTSALHAIERAHGATTPLELRDGAPEGTVKTSDGVLLRIRKVIRATGKADLALAEDGPLAGLIDGGGHKSEEARARERIRSLMRMVPVPVDEESVLALCGGNAALAKEAEREIHDESIETLLEAANKVRQLAQAHARDAEEAADRQEADSRVASTRALERVEGLGGEAALVQVPAGEAQDALQATTREHEAALPARKARVDLEALQAEIRESLGEEPSVTALDLEFEEASERVESREASVHRLTEKLTRAREELADAKRSQREAIRRRGDIEGQASRWRERQAILAKPIVGPTAEDVEALAGAVGRARLVAERAASSAEVRADRDLAKRQAELAEESRIKAKGYRDLSAGVASSMATLLDRAGLSGLTVEGGRLAVVEGEKVHDFERRQSDGQRIAVALGVAQKAYPGKLLSLSGRFWTALDDTNRKHFAALAAKAGLWVITELPDTGELHIAPVTTGKEE